MSSFLDKIQYFLNGPVKILTKKVAKSKVQSIAIYGAGEIGSELLEELERDGTNIVAVFDRKAEYVPGKLKQYELQPPQNLTNLPADSAIVVASEAFLDQILQRIEEELGDKTHKVIHL